MRIVHVLTHGNVTRGGAIQAFLLAQGQAAAGHDVHVIANSNPSKPLDSTFGPWMARSPGVRVSAFQMGEKGHEHPSELWRMRRMLAKERPDVLHVHRDTALIFSWLATTGMWSGRGANAGPAFVSQRGTTHGFRSRLIAAAHKSPRVHRIVAVAEAVKNALASYGVDRKKIAVVYGSFDLSRFDPLVSDRSAVRTELGLTDVDEFVVQVGELHKKKAPDIFVKSAQRVLRQRPQAYFALVGRGSREKKLRALIDRLGLGERVKLLGFRTDIANVYAAADVAVNSSIRDEGLTGALREALAMARPTVATDTDGNPEIIHDGKTGILVKKRDPDALAVGILRMLRDRDAARSMGENGRKLVLELMHASVRFARTEAVYREILAERGVTSNFASAAQ